MKNNTMAAKNLQSESPESRSDDQKIEQMSTLVNIPSEMSNHPDAKEIRLFVESFLAIEDEDIRNRILKEVLIASQQYD